MSSSLQEASGETFPALDAIANLRAVFLLRVPELDVQTDRETAMARLSGIHRRAIDRAGFEGMPLASAVQVHGNSVREVFSGEEFPVADCDALVTRERGLCLGIYVADCAAVYIADKLGRGIGLAHSGRKGTELGIISRTIETLCHRTHADPEDLVVQISPSIRPPHYEVDFAADIRRQAAAAGVTEIHDNLRCTASDLSIYYSYRMEKGKTGRMLAALAMI
jgi:copper oxidase (laccase) domain-containing protein